MKSTGEVMGVGETFGEAFVKVAARRRRQAAGIGQGVHQRARTPTSRARSRSRAILVELGFKLVATRGTAAALAAAGVPVTPVNKVAEGRPHIVDMIKNDEIALVVNTVEEKRSRDPGQLRDPPRSAAATSCRPTRRSPARAPRRSACRHARADAVFDPGAARALYRSLDRGASPSAVIRTMTADEQRFRMTVKAPKRLKAELQRLKTVERPPVIQAIAEARSHGDLSENADYDAAKERQGFIEGRIAESRASSPTRRSSIRRMIDADGRFVFGATVELEDIESGDVVTYQIVGDDEADIKHGKISVSSPIARALIGKHRGRHRRSAGAGRRARVRDPGRKLRLTAAVRPRHCILACRAHASDETLTELCDRADAVDRRPVGGRLPRRADAFSTLAGRALAGMVAGKLFTLIAYVGTAARLPVAVSSSAFRRRELQARDLGSCSCCWC